MMKKGIFFIVLPLVVLSFIVYRMTKVYSVSIIDLKAKKEMKFNKERFGEVDLKSKDVEQEYYDLKTYENKLDIVGDDKFKDKVKEALRILWMYDKNESFMMIRRNVFKIIQSNRTTFIYHDDIPVIEISKTMCENSSLTYLASVIAHMGWHAAYLKNKRKKTIDVPHPSQNKIDNTPVDIFGKIKRFDDLYKVEEEAFNYQLSVLEKINAPLSEIRMLKKRDYNDFSLSHDGNYFIEF
jgi:hypothetical protein